MQAEEYARMYELEDRYWWFVGRRHVALRLLRRALGEADKPAVLDLGCGTGVISRDMQEWADPISLDMSDFALNFCKSRGLSKLVKGRGEWLPLRSECVDAVLALDIFEHIEDDGKAFREAFRVLKPGGSLVLSVPAFKVLWGPHDVALMHFRRYTGPAMRQRLRDAGFEVKRLSYSVFFLFPVVVLIRMFEKRKKGAAKASLPNVPPWFNRALIGLQGAEASVIGLASLPWGSSVIAVAQKPYN